jgi:peptidyl-prolyl cis-trans isomerase C
MKGNPMLNRLRTTAAATALAASIVWIAPAAQAQDADTVVATVNGTEITLGHMIMVRAGLPEQYLSLPDDVLWDGILDQLVQQSVLAQTGTEERSKRLALALDNEERALRAAEAVEGIVESATSDSAVQEAYEAAYADGGGVEFNAAHILVETEEAAAALVEQARGGADFATLARENSTGPSGPNGGDLGWFGPGMMVAPFEEAVLALEVGAVSDPVQTQFGWHVIKLNETRTRRPSRRCAKSSSRRSRAPRSRRRSPTCSTVPR